ncbi:MAG: hypothetical protein ACRDIV_13945 [Ktedonobacteraceae bacterium]
MAFKIMQVDTHLSPFYHNVQLDLTRATGILYRQSKRGSDKLHIESRMLQESLYPFVFAQRGEGHDRNIHIFDEGAGVSGTKGIDKRLKLRALHVEIAENQLGDIVLARPDRLFRDKHFANVSTFTQLAERMKIKVIVPQERGIIVYDFTKEADLRAFQEAMIQAYAYIVNQIGYMNRARALKVSKGLYGGGGLALPYVLQRDMAKEYQVPVIYDPWQEAAEDLFKKFTEFNFEMGRIARYVEDKPYIFRLMPDEDFQEYLPVTRLTQANGGYTFISYEPLRKYLSNLSLAGFAKAGTDEQGNEMLIPNAFNAAIPLDLLEPCFAAITGNYLDGTPFERTGGTRQYRREDIETDAILHGLLTSDDGTISTYAEIWCDHPTYSCRAGGYFGQKARVGLGRLENVWNLGIRPIDRIVLDRLIALAEYDDKLVERVKAYFGQRAGEGQSTLEVLDTAILNTQKALKRVSNTILKATEGLVDDNGEPIELDKDDPLLVEKRSLLLQLRRLQIQRDKAAAEAQEDPSRSIVGFYDVLSHLRAKFHKRDPQDKKDIMKKLIKEVKINALSPHLMTLHITWIEPLTTRSGEDVALLWRGTPSKTPTTNDWTEEEEENIRRLYPHAPQLALMQAIPHKTPNQMRDKACTLRVQRDYRRMEKGGKFHWTVTYLDLQQAAAFTETVKEREFLWAQLNEMAKSTKKGDVSVLWFLPIDMISFAKALSVADVLETGVSARTGG